jgi:hypothetical protein
VPSSIIVSPSLSIYVLDIMPVVLAGVGIGCGTGADAVDCEPEWAVEAVWKEDDLSEVAAVVEDMKPPLECELIEGYGGEVGVRGCWGVFVVCPLALAATSKGGEAGENLPIESRRCRFALGSDIEAVGTIVARGEGS